MIRKDPGKVYNGEYLPLSTAIATIIILLLVGLGLYLILSPSNGKVDGTLFIVKDGKEIGRIYLGHQEIMDLCREEQSVIDYKGYVTYCVRDLWVLDLDNPISCTTFNECHEQYMGCGAVNCICELYD